MKYNNHYSHSVCCYIVPILPEYYKKPSEMVYTDTSACKWYISYTINTMTMNKLWRGNSFEFQVKDDVKEKIVSFLLTPEIMKKYWSSRNPVNSFCFVYVDELGKDPAKARVQLLESAGLKIDVDSKYEALLFMEAFEKSDRKFVFILDNLDKNKLDLIDKSFWSYLRAVANQGNVNISFIVFLKEDTTSAEIFPDYFQKYLHKVRVPHSQAS